MFVFDDCSRTAEKSVEDAASLLGGFDPLGFLVTNKDMLLIDNGGQHAGASETASEEQSFFTIDLRPEDSNLL